MSGFQAKHQMPIEDQEELKYMLKVAGGSTDSIGWMLDNDERAVEWYRYYQQKRPAKAQSLKRTILGGGKYMVAAEWPQWFDSDYHPKSAPEEKFLRDENRFDRSEIGAFERDQIIQRVLGNFER